MLPCSRFLFGPFPALERPTWEEPRCSLARETPTPAELDGRLAVTVIAVGTRPMQGAGKPGLPACVHDESRKLSMQLLPDNLRDTITFSAEHLLDVPDADALARPRQRKCPLQYPNVRLHRKI